MVPFNHVMFNYWSLALRNEADANAGKYYGFITATSDNSGSVALYDMIEIEVIHPESGLKAVHTWGGPNSDFAIGITSDDSSNIYVTGSFYGNVDFGDGKPVGSIGDYDIYIAKYSPVGTLEWVKTCGASGGWGYGWDTALDSAGNVFVVGFFANVMDFGWGPVSTTENQWGFLLKLNPDGTSSSVKVWGSEDHFEYLQAYDVAVDYNDNVYVSGYFDGTVDFDGHMVNTNGGRDCFLCRYDQSGAFGWVRTWGGSGHDYSESVVSDNDYIYSTGSFYDSVDFGDGNPITPNGVTDAFLVRYTTDNAFDKLCIARIRSICGPP